MTQESYIQREVLPYQSTRTSKLEYCIQTKTVVVNRGISNIHQSNWNRYNLTKSNKYYRNHYSTRTANHVLAVKNNCNKTLRS